MTERVTMKHIAARAGVSQATVSLALAKHPRIPDATRQRVRSAAAELGYAPNPFVAALMKSRRRGKPLPARPALAIVCAFDRPDAWRTSASATLRHIRSGVLAQAAARGYRGEEIWLGQDGMSGERFSDVLRARGIQGLLLGPLADGAGLPDLRWEEFATVRVGVPLDRPPMRTVCHDNYLSSFTIAGHCRRLGYRRPGLVLLERHNRVLQDRWHAGFCAGVSANPGLDPVRPLIRADWPDRAALAEWLEREKPDAVITPAHEFVGAHLDAIRLSGGPSPGLASLSCPGPGSAVSGIFQDGHTMGSLAADLLIDLVERNERGLPLRATALMVEGEWNAGTTLPGQ